jgi:hypothetical protein
MGCFATLEVLLEVAESFWRSDFVESLVNFKARETALEAQIVE